MQKLLLIFTVIYFLCSCGNPQNGRKSDSAADLSALYNNYYEERMQLFPLEATVNGDNRYNDKLYVDFTDSYREKLRIFYQKYKDSLSHYNRGFLSDDQRVSYDIFAREMDMSLEGLKQVDNYMPFNQFGGLPLSLAQLGSGDGAQPFVMVADYENWAKRMQAFSLWTDSAVVYFNKGIEKNVLLPKVLVEKMIPQMKDLIAIEAKKSLFYELIKKLPKNISKGDKERLDTFYQQTIEKYILPSYAKLHDYLEKVYLPKARNSTGINDISRGASYYNYLVKYWTSTDQPSSEMYKIGLAEVARIRGEMDMVMRQVGFKGSLQDFFTFMQSDKQFMPYKTAKEVLQGFADIQHRIDPNLKKMFGRTPKTKFEIRQTEAFREATASAEYMQGSADGSRPGIFYVPIIDATKYNVTGGFESLFLHEAIPGHHYQISLQQENDSLPKFQRFAWYGAMGEGWALYTESLGKELGLYTDPYQRMGALGDEMHRAIRLVVDVGMHAQGMTREEAIKYMMANEAISEQGAVAEIERYMALPAQALSYKIGSLKIMKLRKKYERELGTRFSISQFHDELLLHGVMPLSILERKMDRWAQTISAGQKK